MYDGNAAFRAFSAGGGFSFPLHCPEPLGGRHQRGETTEPPNLSPPQGGRRRAPHNFSASNGGRRPAGRGGSREGATRPRPLAECGRGAPERGYIFSEGAAGYCVAIRFFDFRLLLQPKSPRDRASKRGGSKTHPHNCLQAHHARLKANEARPAGRLRPAKRGNGRGTCRAGSRGRAIRNAEYFRRGRAHQKHRKGGEFSVSPPTFIRQMFLMYQVK